MLTQADHHGYTRKMKQRPIHSNYKPQNTKEPTMRQKRKELLVIACMETVRLKLITVIWWRTLKYHRWTRSCNQSLETTSQEIANDTPQLKARSKEIHSNAAEAAEPRSYQRETHLEAIEETIDKMFKDVVTESDLHETTEPELAR
jgi:hypothetical protein